MPPKKHPTVWPAAPHTIAKINILKGYLHAWFQIMGRTMPGKDLLYVDGFAGPGEYTNHPVGSPVAALEAAQSVLTSSAGHWKAGDIHCAFIESDRDRYDHLETRLEPFQSIPTIRIHLFNSTFVDGLSQLKRRIPLPFKLSHPLLTFIDPFGVTGAPFSTVADILRSPRSEILMNVDADGIARVYQAGASADRDVLLDEVFGDASWRNVLSGGLEFRTLCGEALNLYRRRLRGLPNVRYTFAFEMRSHADTLNYFLVFASQHPKGLEKMKEAMKAIDQAGDYSFADAHVQQPTLLRFDDVEEWSNRLFGTFRGKKVTWPPLHGYALTETPFSNPKSMLRHLEDRKLIHVVSRDPKRRKGTFNEKNIEYVNFSQGESHGH